MKVVLIACAASLACLVMMDWQFMVRVSQN